MQTSLSFWHLIFAADPIVKCIMLLLLATSVWSWAIIFDRYLLQKRAKAWMEQFRDLYWSSKDLRALFARVQNASMVQFGTGRVFCAAYKAFMRVKEQKGGDHASKMIGIERAIEGALIKEQSRLDSHLSTLATIGSVSPFVGLFGTVWGIMGAFTALGSVQQATLSMVAPGIAEALIATAMGLFVAIPAVIAYNRFQTASDSLMGECDYFQSDLLSYLQHQLLDVSSAAYAK